MVIPPAKTGRDKSKRKTVIKILHKNKFIRSNLILKTRILIIVVIKFKDPIIEERPAI
jgi:hypothetical protein